MEATELQQDVQRFASQFTERITQAMDPLERSASAAISDAALTRNLLYASSAVDIATGPFPEVNLLDMIVFVRLSREVVEEYWVPEVFGPAGRGVESAFRKSEEELWKVADKVMEKERQRDLKELIDQWRAENPDQLRVEGVRLGDFAVTAEKAAESHSAQASGLVSSVKSATRAADHALLFAERSMFLVHRMPFLVRRQTRLAAREIASDACARARARVAAILRCVPGVALMTHALALYQQAEALVVKHLLARPGSH
jgi:hypothetical protein